VIGSCVAVPDFDKLTRWRNSESPRVGRGWIAQWIGGREAITVRLSRSRTSRGAYVNALNSGLDGGAPSCPQGGVVRWDIVDL
jgi:hypothetical protein